MWLQKNNSIQMVVLTAAFIFLLELKKQNKKTHISQKTLQ